MYILEFYMYVLLYWPQNASQERVSRARVPRGDNVGLHRGVDGVRGVRRGHDAFVEGAHRAVGVVAADTEDDGALLLHRRVARRAVAVPVDLERPRLRVAALVLAATTAAGGLGWKSPARRPRAGATLEH